MKLTKQLMCLAMAGVMTLSQVPVVSFSAGSDKTVLGTTGTDTSTPSNTASESETNKNQESGQDKSTDEGNKSTDTSSSDESTEKAEWKRSSPKKDDSMLSFNRDSVTLYTLDERVDISGYLEYSEDIELTSISYESSDTGVVKFDEDGLLHAVADGKAKVTVTADEEYDETATPSTIKVYTASLEVNVELRNGIWTSDKGIMYYYVNGVAGDGTYGRGIEIIDGKKYCVRKHDGRILTDALIFDEQEDGSYDFYYFGKDGVMVTSAFVELAAWQFPWDVVYDEEADDWVEVLVSLDDDEKSEYENNEDATVKRYFGEDGRMVKDATVEVDGVMYKLNKNGRIVSQWTVTSDSSSSGRSGGGGSSSSSTSDSSSTSGSINNSSTSDSGATVSKSETTAEDGSKITFATISLGGVEMAVSSQVWTLANGSTQKIVYVSGNPAGLTFANVGTVSADGLTLVGLDGQVYQITYNPMFIVTAADGTTLGYFFDPVTNQPMTFLTDTVIMQLGIDGQMHAHFVHANGYFYTGTMLINGMTVTFNEEGVMVSATTA